MLIHVPVELCGAGRYVAVSVTAAEMWKVKRRKSSRN